MGLPTVALYHKVSTSAALKGQPSLPTSSFCEVSRSNPGFGGLDLCGGVETGPPPPQIWMARGPELVQLAVEGPMDELLTKDLNAIFNNLDQKSCDFSNRRCRAQERMKSQSSYVSPPYVPLDQPEPEVETLPSSGDPAIHQPISAGLTHWSSGICACFDDVQSCMLLSVLRP